MAEMQVQLWLQLAQHKVPIPTSPETYHLLHSPTGRIQYGVDYSTYQAQLARDMGSAPGLVDLWWQHGTFVTLIYWCVPRGLNMKGWGCSLTRSLSFGASFPTFYRLTGPYKSDVAPQIVKTEICDTIARRGVAGNIFMGVIPMVFYAWINLMAYLAETVWVVAAPLLGVRPHTSKGLHG